MAESPTMPQPTTATTPSGRVAVGELMAGTSPVVIPQPMAAPMPKGSSRGTGTAAASATTTWSAWAPMSMNLCDGPFAVTEWPAAVREAAGAGGSGTGLAEQRLIRSQ